MRIISIIVLALLLLSPTRQEEHQFVAQVGRLMDIIINSLYTQKQIFLRELISNASDALDKIRFLAIGDPDVLGTETELEIKIQYDEDQKILEIIDNGIGMTKNDLIQNLGTVARTGTIQFLEALKEGSINLIGQFGVGFYSSFLVGSKVEVISKHNDDSQHKWTSSASNTFMIEDDNSIELKRGTVVRLHLKEDATEFCQFEQLEKLVQRYSSFINYPIYLMKKVAQEEKTEKTEAEIEAEKEKLIQQWKSEGKEIDDEEIENSINRTVTKTVWKTQFQRINENKPIWTRDKNEVTKSQYEEFYKALFKDSVPPLTWNHFKAQGDVQFTGLMYVPERAPYDQYEKFFQKKSQVKLFVRRVLINDEFEDLLPRYLNFLKVLVDSDALPLNVNRETLQQDKTLKSIGNKLTKKAVDMLVSFNPDPEDEQLEFDSEDEKDPEFESPYDKKVSVFNKFWKNFAKNLKFGIIEDSANREKLAVLTRWYTTNNVTQLTSLDQYISRMKQGQKNIYFLGGDNREVLAKSPFIEKLVQQGYEVILGDDALDETLFQNFREYKTYRIVNVARNDFKEPYKSDQLRKEVKYLTKTYQPLIDYMKKELKDHIKDVKVSMRLVNYPAVIVADMMNDTPNRERLEAATAMKANLQYSREKNILEINAHHPVVQELNKIIEDEPDENTATLVKNLYHAGLIHSGYLVKDPFFFSNSVFQLINTAFGVKQEIEDIQVTQQQVDQMEEEQIKEKEKRQGAKADQKETVEVDPQNAKTVEDEVLDLDQQGNSQKQVQQESQEKQQNENKEQEQENTPQSGQL